MNGLSDSELDYLDESEMRAYAEDQRQVLAEAESVVGQLVLCGLITTYEAAIVRRAFVN